MVYFLTNINIRLHCYSKVLYEAHLTILSMSLFSLEVVAMFLSVRALISSRRLLW